MEHKIKATFWRVQDMDKFIDYLVDNGIDPDTEIELMYLNGKHIIEYIIDDNDIYVEPEEFIAHCVDFLDDKRIRHYSFSLDDNEYKH